MDLVDRSEKFIGFYSADGFWVGEAIDYQDPDKSRKLTGIIPEIAIEFRCEEFGIAVCVDGLMLLRVEHLAQAVPQVGDPQQFAASLQWWDEHLDYANVLQLALESESIKCNISSEVTGTAVAISDTCRVGFLDGIAVNWNHDNQRSLVAARHEILVWLVNGQKGPPPHAVSSAWKPWAVVTSDAVRSAIGTFKLISYDKDLVKRLSFLAKAKASFAKNDYRVAFTLLWFVIESAAKALITNGANVSIQRLSMKAVGDELRSKSLISDEIFELLKVLRSDIRNRLVHEPGTTFCLPEHCLAAAKLAIDLAVRNPAIDLRLNWESGVQY